MEHIFAGLNDKQIEAVKATEGPVLVISGPGSGKTRCLTHRVAYLISTGVPADKILALTFTNKAAGEVRERVHSLLTTSNGSRMKNSVSPTIGTFHSLGMRILRREIELLGYGTNFNILDTSDQQAVMKKVLLAMELDIKKFTPSSVLNKVSKLKTDLITPETHKPGHGFMEGIVARAYTSYQSELQKLNGVDFDDLIGLPVKIFRKHPEILERYQNYWQYVLVDEYQDTSHDQYTLVSLLAKKHRNLFCIGDDAQSIYMFREADIRNILNFQKDYPDGKIILLEQNYRSTQNIIAAAQAVILNNRQQIPKELWTANPAGDKIVAKETINERDEANFVVQTIEELLEKKYKLEDFAVLYRTHAQSRAIEEALINSGFPYQIVGGIKFYDRREIKDMLAYLRFFNNPQDYVSFERIANVPTRSIGSVTLEKIVSTGKENLIDAVAEAAVQEKASSKKGAALKSLANTLGELHGSLAESTLSGFIKKIIKRTGYEQYLRGVEDKYENADERIENLAELLTVAKKFDSSGSLALGEFLEQVTLMQETDKLKEDAKRATLMTMHSSKGLEFPVVFIIGMEEGLFPHNRTLFVPEELEEERRLCYVAVTRAKEKVFVTFAKFRRIFGSAQANLPSRFLGEMPTKLIDYRLIDDGEEYDTIEY